MALYRRVYIDSQSAEFVVNVTCNQNDSEVAISGTGISVLVQKYVYNSTNRTWIWTGVTNNETLSKDTKIRVSYSGLSTSTGGWKYVSGQDDSSKEYSLQTTDQTTGQSVPLSGTVSLVFEYRYTWRYDKADNRPSNNDFYPSGSGWNYLTLENYIPNGRNTIVSNTNLHAVQDVGSGFERKFAWKFLGWTATSGFNDTTTTAPGLTIYGSRNFYLLVRRYTLTLNLNGGTGLGSAIKGYYNNGTTDYSTMAGTSGTDTSGNVTVSADWYGNVGLPESVSHPDGYEFLGWLVDGETELRAAGAIYDLQDDVTATAVWNTFTLTVSKTAANAAVGTLKLVRISGSDYTVVATEDSTTHELSYTGSAGVEYNVILDMTGENEDLYLLQGIEGGNSFTPASGAELEKTFVITTKTLCPIVLPTTDTDGNTITATVTSPSSPDGTVAVGGVDTDAYVEGRDVVVLIESEDSGLMPEEVYLDDLNGFNYATFTRDSMDGGSFTIRSIQSGCRVRVKTGERMYAVAANAATGHDVAFESLTATAGGSAATSVGYNTQVTFAATMNGDEGDYVFDGWYLGDVLKSTSATYTVAVTEDMQLEARAKAKVTLALELDGVAAEDAVLTTPDPDNDPFYVEIGDTFAYGIVLTDGAYFWGWFSSTDTDHDTRLPYGQNSIASGIVVTGVTSLKAWIKDEEPTGTVETVIAYAAGCDSSMGTIAIAGYGDGNGGTGEGASATATIGSSTGAENVELRVETMNGFQFVGWYTNADAQGTPKSASKAFTYTPTLNLTLYALFATARRSLCRWEGSNEPKTMTWRSKTYEASKPFAPSACRVDALGYPPNPANVLALTVDMFSAPDVAAQPTGHVTLDNISNQSARRLPVLRQERYMQIEVVANREIDAVLAGTSMGGLAT